ncbi:MAG: PCMD domain-containing protein [Bacteroidia bacterium]|nr:PCMD domain-containing protein [Bacteroidia bacterium]
MQKTFTTILSLSITLFSLAQTQLTNAGFENWGGSGSSAEPTSWNSNKTGTGLASTGPQTCFQETSAPHSGTSCVRVETIYYILAVVNGNVTTGVVNAPSTNKSQGYLSATGSDKLAFTGRPDSIVGWYKYTQATSGTGAAAEQAKVYAVLHSGDYYDPAAPVSGNHPDLSANKIGDALYVSPAANQSSWKRFTVPFNYINSNTPAFIMVNITSSNNQLTTAPGSTGSGSKLWVDDLELIYNNTTSINETEFTKNVKVYYFEKNIYVDFLNKNSEQSIIDIYNATGQIVYSQIIDNSIVNTISISSLKSGIYMYKVSGKSQGKFGKLFID